MDVPNDDQLEWRDTYFILFDQSDRPTLSQMEAVEALCPARAQAAHCTHHAGNRLWRRADLRH